MDLSKLGTCPICGGTLAVDGDTSLVTCHDHPEHFEITMTDYDAAWSAYETGTRKLETLDVLIDDLERGNRTGVKTERTRRFVDGNWQTIQEGEEGDEGADGDAAEGAGSNGGAASAVDAAAVQGGATGEGHPSGSSQDHNLAQPVAGGLQPEGADRGGGVPNAAGADRPVTDRDDGSYAKGAGGATQ